MVILERTFTAADESIQLEVYSPIANPDDHECRYRIHGAGLDRSFRGYGIDPVQALLLALANAHVDLLAMRRDTGLPILWLGSRDLGLPLASSISAADFDT